MPQRHSGVKELRKTQARHAHNLDLKTDLKKTIKNFLSLVGKKEKKEASDSIKTVYKKLDKAAKRNLIARNTAARRKSRFAKLLAGIA